MSAENRDDEEQEAERYDVEPPRSIFAALWFRVVLVVIVIGVVAAVAVPYLLEWMSPPPPRATAAKPTIPVTKPPAPLAAVPPAPARPEAPPPAAAAPAPAGGALAPRVEAKPPAPAIVEKPTPAEKPPVAEKPPAPKPARRALARRPAKAVAKAPAVTPGAYFVQVGAFTDAERARRLETKLRDEKFRVAESTTGAGGERAAAPGPPAAAGNGDRYDVFVSGGSVADINAKLAAKGLATATAARGVVVKPSLPLRDAVALSKDLAIEGLKVQVRRAAGAAGAPAPARAPAPAGEGLHRVMVGPFPDRAAAGEALQALRDKGYKDSFIARGGA